jgi:beta-phosphoglucomutase family hydrolase
MDEPPFAVVWDMDGVLVDSAPYHFRAWQEVFAAEGISFDQEAFRRTFGQRNDTIIADVLGPDIPPARVAAIGAAKEARYRSLIAREGISPLPGASDWIRRLHERGIPQAIASSAPRANIEAVLKALAWETFFEAIVSAEDVAQGKPDPASFLIAAQRLGMPPDRCIVIEDAPAGIEAARRAGMRCIALSTSHPPHALSGADRVIPTLEILPPDALDRLLGAE